MTSKATPRSPLAILAGVNSLQIWRKLKGIRQQSTLLTGVIFAFIIGYSGLAFWLFRAGLNFVAKFPGFGTLLTERLLFLLFAFLFFLLLASNLVISYTNFFRNRETNYLISLPIDFQTIFRWKFFESALLASWAFLFLIAPLLAAYGLVREAPWHFYVLTFFLILFFIVLPCVCGSWLAVVLARFLDRRSFQVLIIMVAVGLLIAAAFWLAPEPLSDEIAEKRVLAVMDRLLVKTRFAHFPLLPSYWLSQSVLQFSEGARRSAGFFVLVLVSNVLFFGSLIFTRMGGWFYDGFSRVQSRAHFFGEWEWFRQRRNKENIFYFAEGAAEKAAGALRWLSLETRALLVKDARMFWRDTTQWGQTLVLFGLLGVYIINLRHFSSQLTNPFWVHLVSYLNLGACALNLATLTTRFVFPQFSLEGKRLWIVGMAPIGLKGVLRVKFWEAGCAALVVTLGLITLSCQMLKMPGSRTWLFALAITVMTFSLTALAVGLGALYPNFKEDNPSKIVSGFGGTFCLVLSFVYIVASVALLAYGSPWSLQAEHKEMKIILGWLGFACLSAVMGGIPMRLGLQRASKVEI